MLGFKVAGFGFELIGNDHVELDCSDVRLTTYQKSEEQSGLDKIYIDFQLDSTSRFYSNELNVSLDTNLPWSFYRDEVAQYVVCHPQIMTAPAWIMRIVTNQVHLRRSSIIINRDIAKVEDDNKLFAPCPLSYPLDVILTTHALTYESGALFHAAGIEFNEIGLLFPGKSGAGKSTLIKQFRKGSTARLFSDERIAVRNIEDRFTIYGTPWHGDAEVSLDAHSELKGIFFITHGDKNRIQKISPRIAFEKLIPTASVPWYDSTGIVKVLGFLESLVENIPSFELKFKPDVEIVDFIWNVTKSLRF